MSTIVVEFMLPTVIEYALNAGSMERVGGVIRYAESKEIVAWLREGGKLTDELAVNSAMMSTVLSAAGMNAATVTTIATTGLPMLNFAMAGYTILKLRAEIEVLKKEIKRIYDRVDKQFERDREINRRAALRTATDLLDVRSPEYKQQMVGKVSDRLHDATEQLLWDVDQFLGSDARIDEFDQAMGILMFAFHVETLAARCYLEVGELDAARRRLKDSLEELATRTVALVKQLVGDQPALYFHSSVEKCYLDRFIDIERWLRGERNVLRAVIQEHRKEFWNDSAIKGLYTVDHLRRPVLNESPYYLDTIPKAETLIEEFERFRGFLLELEELDGRFESWERLSDTDADRLSNADDYVLLVNKDMIAKVERLSA